MKAIYFILFLFIGNIWTHAAVDPFKFIHYTNKDGLSSSYVKGIKQDKYGFIWVATREDVTRFDGNHFTKFPVYNHLGNVTDIKPQNLICIQDSLLLLESMQNYIYYFDYNEECFKPYVPLYTSLKKDYITYTPTKEVLFIQDNSIYSYHPNSNSITSSGIFQNIDNLSPKEKFFSIAANHENLVTYTSNNRVLLYNFKTKKTSVFDDLPINYTNDIYFLTVDTKNNVWLGFYSEGLLKINTSTGKITALNRDTRLALPHNMIHCITFDKQDRAWIGTENGLCIWDEKRNDFQTLRYDRRDPDGLNTNPIYNAFTDVDGNVWLGTYFGGINFWSNYSSKFKFWQTGNSENHLGGKVVSCFAEDKQKNIWIGTEDMGVNKLNINTGNIEKITESLKNNILSYENVHDLLLVNNNTLWIATYSGGINILDIENKKLAYLNTKTNPGLHSDYIYALTKKDNIIYIGTSKGLTCYDIKTKKFSSFFDDKIINQSVLSFAWQNDTLWMCTYEAVYSYIPKTNYFKKESKLTDDYTFGQIFISSSNQIWLTTNTNGLIHYYPKTETYTVYNKETGFPTNRIFAIEEDNNHSLWLSSNTGLINFFPEKNSYIHYDSNSGVPFNQFNYRAAFKNSDGTIFFGGNEGMTSIANTNDNKSKEPIIQFTEFQLFNKRIYPQKKSPLRQSITETPQIVLNYNQNVITFHFSALNYANKGNTSYAYKMEGFENEFNYVKNRNSATYTNLNPGNYTFLVKASNNAWISESIPKKIHIKIKPPVYLTPIAIASYLIILLIIILIFNRISIRMHNSKAELALERQERINADKINNFKLNFFTNISHEIKTPLSLILGPLSNLLNNEDINSNVKTTLNRIFINVNRLNILLGELLDFRKIENETGNFYVSNFTNFDFLDNIKEAFIPIAENNKIKFSANYNISSKEIWLNKAIVEKIIINLLSNSFKYCNPEDSVSLDVFTNEMQNEINIIVRDNGPGISSDDINRVFSKYYQTKEAKSLNKGYGIGLNYISNLIKIHRGKMKVESQPKEGTLFHIQLPCDISSFTETEIRNNNSLNEIQKGISTTVFTPTKISAVNNVLENLKNKPSILLVEDNMELLDFLETFLKDNYIIQTAHNGKEALNQVKLQQPEIIISDIMMPEMDGLKMTNLLKSDIETSHIPIILLTAKSGINNHYEGLLSGADNYLEKPFVPQILEQCIINIIQTRRNAIIRFSKDDISLIPQDVTSSLKDKEFINDITKIIEANMDNPALDVTLIVEQMRLSRSLIHNKLKSLLNCSTTEYIRIIRLKQAIKLIKNKNFNYTEAAYKTGFTSLTYFSRAFKEQYGVSPRNYFSRD